MDDVQRYVVIETDLASRASVGDKVYAGCVDVVLAADAAAHEAAAVAEARAEQPDYKWDQSEVDELRRQGYEQGQRDVFAFHPEWTVTGMCDPDCLACRRLTELITEREKGYEEGKADAEQAHAAALADANLRWDAEVTRALDEGEKIGRLYGSTPRTLTADDPPPSNESVVLDRLAVAHQRIGAGWYPRGSARGYLWADMNFPVTLIHDGEATP